MKSKLLTQYPAADPEMWLKFTHPWQTGIDPVFAGRLAALAQSVDKKITVMSGFRSYEEQVNSYKSTGGDQDRSGNWVGGNGYAARPGSSWHEYRLAIDASDTWLKALEKDLPTDKQATLLKFGLFKPLTRGNGCTVLEDWHIQPIETKGVSNKQSFMPEVTGDMDVKEFQRVMGLEADGITGPKTTAKAREVKEAINSILADNNAPVKTGEEAVMWLADNKVIASPDYWLLRINEVKYLDALLVKIVSELKG